MKSLGPPLVAFNAEAWNCRGVVDQQLHLLLQRQPSNEVVNPALYRQLNLTEREVYRSPIIWVTSEWLDSCGHTPQEKGEKGQRY
uniref:Uncharacterized protein n=1 Tax=Rhizophora mucronata TaxID=61149 RepID=A0A2P2NUI7_RHIMU